MKRLPTVLLVTLGLPPALQAAAPDPALLRERVRAWRTTHEAEVLREFASLLSLPNLASDATGIRRNAEAIQVLLERRDVAARLLEVEGAPPAVFGERRAPGARTTVAFYAHYDGQPVDPARWTGEPWVPVLRDGPLEAGGREVALDALREASGPEWRLYARSAADDKGSIVAMIAALDALRATGIAPSVNLKFFFEGEEEAGSPHLAEMLKRHAQLLGADLWLLCDGPVHQTRRMQVFFGARGVMGLELTLYGPARALHSGHYGNFAPNPAATLAHLIAGLRDADGRVRVAGFYDDVRPLSESERRALAAMPAVESELRQELQLGPGEGVIPIGQSVLRPGLNVRGLESGRVGAAAANAIPTEARASFDFRLVPDQEPERVRERLEAHLRREGYHVVHQAPDADTRRAHARVVRLEWEAGYPAARTSMELPMAQALLRVAREVAGDVVAAPTLGGSIPMYLFAERAPVIGLPIANHDNNQHAADENIRLQNLWDGIELFAAVFARLEAP